VPDLSVQSFLCTAEHMHDVHVRYDVTSYSECMQQ
jgi:hypothetical protein